MENVDTFAQEELFSQQAMAPLITFPGTNEVLRVTWEDVSFRTEEEILTKKKTPVPCDGGLSMFMHREVTQLSCATATGELQIWGIAMDIYEESVYEKCFSCPSPTCKNIDLWFQKKVSLFHGEGKQIYACKFLSFQKTAHEEKESEAICEIKNTRTLLNSTTGELVCSDHLLLRVAFSIHKIIY